MAKLALEVPLRSFPFVLDMVDVDSEKWKALATTANAPTRWVYASEARRLRQRAAQGGGEVRPQAARPAQVLAALDVLADRHQLAAALGEQLRPELVKRSIERVGLECERDRAPRKARRALDACERRVRHRIARAQSQRSARGCAGPLDLPRRQARARNQQQAARIAGATALRVEQRQRRARRSRLDQPLGFSVRVAGRRQREAKQGTCDPQKRHHALTRLGVQGSVR
jgi:hypothetical protein